MVCVLTAYLTGFANFIGNFIFSHKTMSLVNQSRRKKMTGKDHIRNSKNAFIVKRKRKKIIKIL